MIDENMWSDFSICRVKHKEYQFKQKRDKTEQTHKMNRLNSLTGS